jgi:hypothetical protein
MFMQRNDAFIGHVPMQNIHVLTGTKDLEKHSLIKVHLFQFFVVTDHVLPPFLAASKLALWRGLATRVTSVFVLGAAPLGYGRLL